MRENAEDKEVLNTEKMLMSGFFKNLEKKNIKLPEASDADMGESNDHDIVQAKFESEQMLIDLYDVRDNLIEAFAGTNLNSSESQRIVSNINKIGSCIRRMGGDVEEFIPINHVSGLTTPPSHKNMQRVIETTQSCYVLGKVVEPVINDNSIELTFTGKNGNVRYAAKGTITAKDCWAGNEAIDYIYTPSSGRMSVKAFEKGIWVDKSDNFDVAWDLEEDDSSEKKDTPNEASGQPDLTIKQESAKKEKDIEIDLKNNLDDGDEDFSISSK